MNDCLVKFVPDRFREDFKQELFLIICENRDSVYRANNEGKLLFYAVRIIINLVRQTRNIYHKEYLQKQTDEIMDYMTSIPCEPSYTLEIRQLIEDEQDEKIRKIKESEDDLNTPYYRMLGEALEIHGSAGKVAKATGIPKSSVQVGIKKLRKYLNE